MKFLRSGRTIVVLACALMSVSVALGMGTNNRRLTLLVTPARHSTLQVAFDILARENAVLVAYQGDATSPKPILHVWSGVEWLQISLDEFSSLSFLRSLPSQILLVGDDEVLPGILVDSAMASPQGRVMQIPSQDTATVINSLGQILDFGRTDWTWYAARYRLDLQDVNASIRDRSWYDQPNTFQNRASSPYQDSNVAPAYSPAMDSIDLPEITEIPVEGMPMIDAEESVVIPPAAEISVPWDESATATEAPIK